MSGLAQKIVPVAVLLAGGQARRMGGGDKCMLALAGRTLLAHSIERIGPQVQQVLINANGDPERFANFDLPVAKDSVEGFVGPLAGVLTGMEWAQAHVPEATHVVSIATDTPFFPADLVARLIQAAETGKTPLAVAASSGRSHPVFGLWPLSLIGDLREAVAIEGLRKVDIWTARHGVTVAAFSGRDFELVGGDPFFNLNQPKDIEEAEARIGRGG